MKSYLKELSNGTKVWRNNKDQFHREDGPAFESANGFKSYYINNELHREDGPAIEYADGDKEYYIHDRLLTPEQFKLRKRLMELIK